jgi:hypothetical protein
MPARTVKEPQLLRPRLVQDNPEHYERYAQCEHLRNARHDGFSDAEVPGTRAHAVPSTPGTKR